MRDKGLDFDVVLKEAQRLGYAEADPTFDIEGVDAAHKATIMSAIAFGIPMQFDKAHVEGIVGPAGRRHQARRGAGLPHQAAGHHAPPRRRQRHRAARAPDAGAGQAPDRQRRGRDERRAWCRPTRSAPRCTTARARAPSPPPRPWWPTWSTSRACTPPTPTTACRTWRSAPIRWPPRRILPHRRRRHLVLPAPVRGRRGGRAVEDHHHAGRARHLHRRRAAAPQPRAQGRPAGPHHPHAQHRRGQDAQGHRADAGAADGAGADRHASARKTWPDDEVRQHPRRPDAALLHRDPARGPGARRRAVPARALSAGRRGHARRAGAAAYAELAFEILSLYIDDIPAADLRALAAKTYTRRGLRHRRHRAAASRWSRACTC